MNWMIMPYQRMFDFEGRSRRKEYWMYTLLQVLIVCAMLLLFLAVGPRGQDRDASVTFIYAVAIIYTLANFFPHLAVQVRRLHDQNLTGWLSLLSFIPYIGGFIVLIFMMIEGTRGPNQYGDDPKRPGVNPDIFA